MEAVWKKIFIYPRIIVDWRFRSLEDEDLNTDSYAANPPGSGTWERNHVDGP